MGYARLVKLVDYDKLTEKQRSALKDLLEKRRAELQEAMDDVEEGLDRLKPKSKKSAKGKTKKR